MIFLICISFCLLLFGFISFLDTFEIAHTALFKYSIDIPFVLSWRDAVLIFIHYLFFYQQFVLFLQLTESIRLIEKPSSFIYFRNGRN